MKNSRLNPVKAIRAFCLQCVAGQREEVKLCPSKDYCPLWPFRFGKNPYVKRDYSEEHKKKLRDSIQIARKHRSAIKEISVEPPQNDEAMQS